MSSYLTPILGGICFLQFYTIIFLHQLSPNCKCNCTGSTAAAPSAPSAAAKAAEAPKKNPNQVPAAARQEPTHQQQAAAQPSYRPAAAEVEPYRGFARCILAIFQKYAIFAQF